MTVIIVILITALLTGIISLFFTSELLTSLYDIVFDCGQTLSTFTGVSFFGLVMPITYGIGISLIILKFLKKAFDIYVLWTDGDPDADPFLLLTNFVRAVGTALIFQWLYGIFVDICRDITNQIMTSIDGGREMTTEWVTAITSLGIVPAIARPIAWFDRHVVDGFMNLLARTTQSAALGIRFMQSGSVQRYCIWFFAGTLGLTLLLLILR